MAGWDRGVEEGWQRVWRRATPAPVADIIKSELSIKPTIEGSDLVVANPPLVHVAVVVRLDDQKVAAIKLLDLEHLLLRNKGVRRV